MSDGGSTPAGWYHAPGDAEGTQRYWDGAQWVGEPQPVQQAAPAYQTPAYQAPAAQQTPPSYGAPGAASYGAPGASYSAAPTGYEAYGAAPSVGVPADIGARLKAYFIDIAPVVGIFVVMIGGVIALGDAGIVAILVGFAAILAYVIWNFWYRRGSTGQSIGDSKANVKLVTDVSGQPIGGGMAFLRYFATGVISNFTCGVFGLLDILWPLWDQENKRLADKMFKCTVVTA